MKRNVSLFLVTILSLLFLAGCGNALKVESNTVYVQKKGKITGATVESFDKNYYDAAELETYINECVDQYIAEHDKKSVVLDSFSVEEGVARLNIQYAGYEDYADFNEVELFAGTVPQAMAAGYDFEDTFLAAEDGVLGGTATKGEATADDGYKVVILSEKVDVKVDGTILYVSQNYTSLKDKSTVSIVLPEDAQDGAELALTYIIYK